MSVPEELRPTPEYLHDFKPECYQGISVEEMLDKQIVVHPAILHQALSEALVYLRTAPGPNLERRKILAEEWLTPWITIFAREVKPVKGHELIRSYGVFTFERIKEYMHESMKSIRSGLIFMAGAEGHPGHIWAMQHIRNTHAYPVVLAIDQPEVVEAKSRGGVFLPGWMRYSMWALSPYVDAVTQIPTRPENVNAAQFYNDIARQLDPAYFFATIGDKHFQEKVARSRLQADFLGIPPLPTESTTFRVESLAPDDNEFYFNSLFNEQLIFPNSRVKHGVDASDLWRKATEADLL